MTLNRDYIGRSFPPSEPYEVSRIKIAEFADAIGDPSPLCRDRRGPGRRVPDVIAPPTFAIVITMANSSYAVTDQDLGLDYSMVVHGEQRFEHRVRCTPGTWWWRSPRSPTSGTPGATSC